MSECPGGGWRSGPRRGTQGATPVPFLSVRAFLWVREEGGRIRLTLVAGVSLAEAHFVWTRHGARPDGGTKAQVRPASEGGAR